MGVGTATWCRQVPNWQVRAPYEKEAKIMDGMMDGIGVVAQRYRACAGRGVAPHLTVMDYGRAEHDPWSLGSVSVVLL